MADINKIFEEYLKEYIKTIPKRWESNKYKWEAPKTFNNNWDPEAADFPAMLRNCLEGTDNLLDEAGRKILRFAKSKPKDVQLMFKELFNEDKGYFERIAAFKEASDNIASARKAIPSRQDDFAISVYLWLRYPDKYACISNKHDAQTAKDKLEGQDHEEEFKDFVDFYRCINENLKKYEKLKEQLDKYLTKEGLSDPELNTLTSDVVDYISHKDIYNHTAPYSSGPDLELSEEEWAGLLKNKSVFTPESLTIMARLKDCGGAASSKQLASRYGGANYDEVSNALGERVYKTVKKDAQSQNETPSKTSQFWSVLYSSNHKDMNGYPIWEMREELSRAFDTLDKVHLEAVNLYENSGLKYWWLSYNPKIFDLSELSVGEGRSFSLYNENGRPHRILRNLLDAKVGDKVIGFESGPTKSITSLLKIDDRNDKEIKFRKSEGLISPVTLTRLKSCPDLKDLDRFDNSYGNLFELKKEEYEILEDIICEENPRHSDSSNESYGENDFLEDVYMSRPQYKQLRAVLERNKNIILEGVPGVGKTYAAKRLAWSMMGEKDKTKIQFVQFHQNYTYEDFVMGYKPSGEGFELKDGIFYRFCQKARNDPKENFFFIIDEINRGNLSKIFGELLMLIEKDHRGEEITLAYNGLPFSVPENLYIIGMMNTADRSLAMLDYALRRRFSFFNMEPAFDSEQFKAYKEKLNSPRFNELIDHQIKDLNEDITESLGKEFCIGHSYFCGLDKEKLTEEELDTKLRSIVNFDIIPTLKEYWFDDGSKLEKWEDSLRKAVSNGSEA